MISPRLRWNWGWALLGSTLLLLTPVACAANESAMTEGAVVLSSSRHTSFQQLLSADIIYLGEQHDSAADHAAQLEIIQALYAEKRNLAIALEMFQRPFQPVLDRYLAGDLSEADLIEQTEYAQRWGFPWEYYAPILRFARQHQLPVLALNAPSEVTHQVARAGLEHLSAADWRYIPPSDEIDLSNDDYRAWVRGAFQCHDPHGSFDFENFFAAQVLWDETMALGIADFRRTHPRTQVVVLAGQGHVIYGYGIPDRVARRLGADLSQTVVLLNPHPDLIAADDAGAIADVFWISE